MTSQDAADPNDTPHLAPTAQTPAANAKVRSPVERRIVRSVIALLLVVMVLELFAYFSFRSDYMAVAEARNTDTITESDVRRLLTRYSSIESNANLTANELVATREDIYRYWGLLKRRTLYVYYGVMVAGETEPEVLDVRLERADFADVGTRPPRAAGPGNGPEINGAPIAPATSDTAETVDDEPVTDAP